MFEPKTFVLTVTFRILPEQSDLFMGNSSSRNSIEERSPNKNIERRVPVHMISFESIYINKI